MYYTKQQMIDKKYMNAFYTLIGVSAQEVAQALSLYPGTFDPFDFLANAIGVSIAVLVDHLVSQK